MKNPIPAIALVIGTGLATGGCAALGEIISSEEGGPTAEEVGTTAGDVAGLVTGNPMIDMGVTALVGAAAGFFLRKKKKAPVPTVA